MRLVVATRNRGKLEEVRSFLAPLGFELWSMDEVGFRGDLAEDGHSFEENARQKAAGLLAQVPAWTLADDSGLEVDALGGAPGVRSARYAGDAPEAAGRDQANNRKLLHALQAVPDPDRTARFVCYLVLLGADGREVAVRGECAGRILRAPRGSGGFGYDPLFLPDGFDRTMAELSLPEKNRISHRGRALAELVARLRPLV
jgi:XTP/dITP diphosphohydrolase